MDGIFGGMFDFNGDGHMDACERAFEFGLLEHMEEEDAREELKSKGFDYDELDHMTIFERRNALSGTGFDPDTIFG